MLDPKPGSQNDFRKGLAVFSIITAELTGLTVLGVWLGQTISEHFGWGMVGTLPFALLGFGLGLWLVVVTTMRKEPKEGSNSEKK